VAAVSRKENTEMEQLTDPETIARLFGRDALITPPVATTPTEKDFSIQVYEYLTVEAAQ
jgi:hypothetical protein